MTDSQVDAGTLVADSIPGQGRILEENKDRSRQGWIRVEWDLEELKQLVYI